MSGAVGHKRVPREFIENLEFPFPPVQEQKRIVAILDEAFAGIETAIANTEKNLEGVREIFDSVLSQSFADELEDVSWRPLQKIANFIDYRGKTPKKLDSGLRLITAKNVRMGFLQREPEEFVDPETYDAWMTRGIPRKGDVLFTTEAPLGLVCQLDSDEKVVFAQRIITLQPDREVVNPEYLKYALMSRPIQASIHENATGATAKGIKASLLRKIDVPLPDVAVQEGMCASLRSIERDVKIVSEKFDRKLANLSELKQSLLQKAFSGELTADCAERDVESATG